LLLLDDDRLRGSVGAAAAAVFVKRHFDMLALLADLPDIAGARAFDAKERARIFLPVGLVKF